MALRSLTLGIVLTVAGAAGSAQATQFVVNGDFTELSNGLGQFDKKTTVTGWSGNGGYNFVFNVADQDVPGEDGGVGLWDKANSGASDWDGMTKSGAGNYAALDGAFETDAITQTITNLTIGQTYTLSFNYAFAQQSGFDGQTWQDLTASIGGFSVTLPSPFTNCTGGDGDGQTCEGGYNLASHGFSGWTTYSTTFVADAMTETLSFLADGSKPVPPFALVSDVSIIGGVPEPSTWAMMLIGFGGLGYAAFRQNRRKAAAAAV